MRFGMSKNTARKEEVFSRDKERREEETKIATALLSASLSHHTIKGQKMTQQNKLFNLYLLKISFSMSFTSKILYLNRILGLFFSKILNRAYSKLCL